MMATVRSPIFSQFILGALLMEIAGGTAIASEPPGASLAWSSNEPAIIQSREALSSGAWQKAELLLDNNRSPAAAEMRELIARLHYEYSLSDEDFLKKLSPVLPSTTIADIQRWAARDELQSRTVDGHRRIFRREPANLFRFCPEAIQRRAPNSSSIPTTDWSLPRHLSAIIAEADRTGATDLLPVEHTVRHRITVPHAAPGMKPGSRVRAWLPFPQEYGRRQYNLRLVNASDTNAIIAPSARGEDTIEEGAAQRSIYFESIATESKDLVFEASFAFTSTAYYPKLIDSDARPLSLAWSGAHLHERPPHIIFTDDLKRVVSDTVGTETNPLVRARRIFHWIDSHITYHAENEYCLIPSLVTKGLATRRGDCGVQAMLFIAMCRCSGIPARWQSGWETKPGDSDMHDWAEFYVEPWGWLPADASYGLQKSDDPRIREFYFGHQDSYRLIVSRDYGAPFLPAMAELRSEPLDFQRGEVEIDGKTLYFSHWDYDVSIDYDHKR
jgi:transglutaminase-like putative cysteine protease